MLAFASSFVPGTTLRTSKTSICKHGIQNRTCAIRMDAGPIGIGVIGAGRIGQVHARTLASLPGANLIAVADPFEKPGREVAAKFNTTWEKDWETLVNDPRIQGIVIGSPTPFHAEQLIACAEAGKDIFCEKPISNDLAIIDKCLKIIESSKSKLLVGFQRRFDSNFQKLHDQIRMGVIGQVRTFSIISRDPAPPPASYLEKSGGIFLDMASHDFDMARFLTGAEILEVYVCGKAFDKEAQAAGDLDTVITTLKMSDGSFGTITNSRKCSYGYDQRIEIFGSEGSIVSNNRNPDSVVINTGTGISTGLPYSFFMDRYKDAYETAMITFVDMIRTDAPSPVTGADGRAPIIAGMAAARSVETGGPIKCSDILVPV